MTLLMQRELLLMGLLLVALILTMALLAVTRSRSQRE
jgi:hypothetical protein